jgi:hypothetical protein
VYGILKSRCRVAEYEVCFRSVGHADAAGPALATAIASCDHKTGPAVAAKDLGVDRHALGKRIVRSRTRQLAIGGLKCAAGQACRRGAAQDLAVLAYDGDGQGDGAAAEHGAQRHDTENSHS